MRRLLSRLLLLGALHGGFAPLAEAQGDDLATARALLETQASAEDPRVRAAAITALIETGEGSWATRGRNDSAASVRRASLEATATHLPDPSALGLLIEALAHREIDNLGACLSALPIAGEPAVATLAWRRVEQARDDGDAMPCYLLALRAGRTEATAPLAAALGRGRLRLDQGFILALAHTPEPTLTLSLRQGEARLPSEALLSSRVIRAAHGDDVARRALQDTVLGEDEDAAMEIVDLLLALSGPTTSSETSTWASSLLHRARRSPSPRVEHYARLAGLARGDEARRSVRLALDDPDGERLDLAITCLLLAPDETADSARRRTAARLFDVAEQSGRERIWIQASRLAALHPDLPADEALARWLTDDEPLVQIAAARARLLRGDAPPQGAGAPPGRD